MAADIRRLGKVLGAPLELVLTSDNQVPDILVWGDQFVVIDLGKSTRKETEKLPSAYARVEGLAWIPYLRYCAVAHRFKPLPAVYRR